MSARHARMPYLPPAIARKWKGSLYVSTKLAGAVPFDAAHMLRHADHLLPHVANESALQKAKRSSSGVCPNAIFAPGNRTEMERLIEGVRRLASNQSMAQTVHAAISAVQDDQRMNGLVERMSRLVEMVRRI